MFDPIITEAHARKNSLVLAEGKTKIIARKEGDNSTVNIISKDDITAGDGAKHDLIEGKATLATQTTCNVFRLLKACGIPVAFTEQVNDTTFSAPLCTMFPYEVVIRREAHGSYLDRNPHLTRGHLFPRLVNEFFLKTHGKKWKDYTLVKDDPLIEFDPATGVINLLYPGHTSEERKTAHPGELVGQKPFLKLPKKEVFERNDEEKILEEMGIIARQTFLVLEKAWQLQGRKLVDFKVEFGLTAHGNLLLADVIDNDSWRLVEKGAYIDKQVYRDGGDLNTVTAKYRQVAELTSRFGIPVQHLILWRDSDKDNLGPFYEPIRKLWPEMQFVFHEVTCSVHKKPGFAYRMLQRYLQEVPDTVIVAFIGQSNGAGPILSANVTVPVITVPASYKEFPDDVWSSLRTPSYVPVMTVLDPANATLAALQILGMRNPSIYAALRFDQETRMPEI